MKVALVNLGNFLNVARGAGYVAGAVMRAGHRLDFFDTVFQPAAEISRQVNAGGYDVLMLSTMTMLFPEAVRLARAVKEGAGLPVLMGGVHPTIVGGRILEEHPEIDYLCIGEGESLAVEFLEHLGKPTLSSLPNLACREGGRVRVNPVREAEPLSKMPPFPWHLFPREAVVQQPQGFLYVNATRGCPFNCTYCCNGIYLKHYGRSYLRFRESEEVITELLELKATHAPRLFFFGDEMMLFDPDYAVGLFEEIRRRVKRPYGCMARVESLTPEMVGQMRRTGCRFVAIGVECGDEEFRRQHLNRHMSNAQILEAAELLRKAEIYFMTFNMIGFPFDDDERLTTATIDLNRKLRPNLAQVAIFYPFPGTRLYERCVAGDLIDPQKMADVKGYGEGSMLRGSSLTDKRRAVEALLNPEGMIVTAGESRWKTALRRHCPPAIWKVLRRVRRKLSPPSE